MQKASLNSISQRRKKILITGSLAHFVHDGFSDVLFILLPLWATGLGLSHAQVGFLKMFLSGSMAIFQVPAGFLAERLGERVILFAGTALAGFAFIMLQTTNSFFGLAVCLLFAGGGCAVQHPLASSLISLAYKSGGRRPALGMYNFAGDLGKVTVPFFTSILISAYSWQVGTTTYGVVGLIAALTILIALISLKAGHEPTGHEPRVGQVEQITSGIIDLRGFSILSLISMIDSSARIGFITFLPF